MRAAVPAARGRSAPTTLYFDSSSSAFLDEPQEVLALYGDDQRVVPDVDAVLLELPDGTRQCVGQLRPIALNLNERGVAVSSATSEYLISGTGPQ